MHSPDLNLLQSLDALLAEGSVLGAARRAGLSPPAMSRTLARIRAATGDPVLVRAGRRLVPSPRALALRERVRTVVIEAASILRPDAGLNVATLDCVFTIRANDYVVATLVPALDRVLTLEAPRVVLRIVPEEDESVEPLRSGGIDLDVGLQTNVGPELRVQTLYRDEYVALVRAGHSLTRGRVTTQRLTKERFAVAPHDALVSRGGRLRVAIAIGLSEATLAPLVARVVPSFLSAAWLASETNYVVVVPGRLAAQVAKTLRLKVLRLPVNRDPLVIAQMWHPRFDADAAHGWLRDAVRRAAEAGGASLDER